MAELNTGSGNKKGKKGGTKKLSTHIDMTPMVDLGFLLITFFMLTVTLSKPQTMEISMPSKAKDDDKTKIKASKAMTIMLGQKDRIFYYFGTREKNIDPEVQKIDYSPDGIRKVLMTRNDSVFKAMKNLRRKLKDQKITQEIFKEQSKNIKGSKNAPIILIKATDESTYKNLVDILDEMQICSIGRFAIVDITQYDKDLIISVDK